MTQTRPPAVILGGIENALSVARSLAHAGIDVYGIGPLASPLRFSRLRERFLAVDGTDPIGNRLDWLLTQSPTGAVVLACDDDGLELLARHRSDLTEHGLIPMEANDEVLLAMLDKAQTYRLAAQAGIDAPRVQRLLKEEDCAEAAHQLGFPLAVKPLHAHRFAKHFRRKAVIVADQDSLKSVFWLTRDLDLDMLATEIIPGSEDQYRSYYTYIDHSGRPLFHFTKRKLRQYPVGFGGGTLHVTEWNAEVAEVGLRFFLSVGIRGLANVEFKRDSRDGLLKLIECNHRFTAANDQIRIAGLDLALVTYNELTGGAQSPNRAYKEGVRLWLPVKDTIAALSLHRAGQLTLRAWLRTILRPQHLPLFSWLDPLPSIVAAIGLLRRLARPGLPGRIRSSLPDEPLSPTSGP